MVFGAILAASDTVAVLSAFAKGSADPNLVTIVVGESLINDAVTIVLYKSLKHNKDILNIDPDQLWLDYLGHQGKLTLQIFENLIASALIGIMYAVIIALILKHKRKYGFFQKLSLNILIPYMSYFTAQAFG